MRTEPGVSLYFRLRDYESWRTVIKASKAQRLGRRQCRMNV